MAKLKNLVPLSYDISQDDDAKEIQTFLCPNSKAVASSKRPPRLESEEKKKRPSSVKRGFTSPGGLTASEKRGIIE